MDQEIKHWIEKEKERQNQGIELIASENYASKEVRAVCGSILTNKYAEGYPGKRYYGGCECVDAIETLAIERACQLFHCRFANVQPHSGSQANAAAYRALLPNGGKILSLVLNDGGHLTHGSPVSFSSCYYQFVHYPLNQEGKLDYDEIQNIARKEKPNLLLAGFSAYPFEIDFQKLKEIADSVPCPLMVDMAHIAGLIAAGETPSCFPYADVVTSTTHKTLRGPRGGLILTNREDLIKKINSAVFPFYQGGPLEHIIAAKAVCFQEALQPSFQQYIRMVKENTLACCERLKELGASVSGTENHLFLLNTMKSFSCTGLEAQTRLEEVGITTNKNMIPGDTLSPKLTSGLRIGFAAITTRGCQVEQAREIGEMIYTLLSGKETKENIQKKVREMTSGWKKIEEI